VVEISPLGLVEMTRQNVTDGPREILTRKCTVCGGDGVLLSEASAAVDTERRLRALATSAPRTKAFKVELNAKVASTLIGSGASRLMAIEEETKRRFLLVSRDDVPVDRFEVLGKGTLASLVGEEAAPVAEGKQIELKLGEVGRHDVHAGVGKLDGLTVSVGDAAGLVGKKAKVRIERVLDGIAYATLVRKAKESDEPITAESAAEKPTRKPPAKKQAEPDELVEEAEPEPEADVAEPEAEAEAEPEPEAEAEAEPEPEAVAEGEAPKKKKTRRGSRGGRRRRKKPVGTAANGGAQEQPSAEGNGEGPKIHLPDPDLGREEPQEEAEAPAVDGAKAQDQDAGQAQPKKKKTRRGSRGGRRRRKPAAQSSSGSSE
jgi:ribonuclease G